MIRTAALALILLATPPGVAFAQEAELSAEDVRVLAYDLANAGDLGRAAELGEALLERDPDDVAALLLLALISSDTGQTRASIGYAQRAFAAAEREEDRFLGARLAANGHAELEQDTRAQFWLRLAREYAPTEAAAVEVAEDYRFLRQRNPWSTQLRFGVTPTNNINNGSSSDTFLLFGQLETGLNNEARALSGLSISAGATTRYRLHEEARSITHADVTFDGTTFVLSPESKDRLEEDRQARIEDRLDACTAAGVDPSECNLDEPPVPGGSDFSYATLSFGITHLRILSEGWRPTTFGLRYGQTWYGGDPYSTFLIGTLAQDWQVSETSEVSATLSLERRAFEEDRPGSKAAGLTGRWTTALPSGDVLSLSAGARRSLSDVGSQQYRTLSLGADYQLSEPVAGVGLGFAVGLERDYDYDFDILYGASRVDTTLTGRIEGEFYEYEYFGFRPVASLEARITESNVDRFDQETLGVGLNLRSSF